MFDINTERALTDLNSLVAAMCFAHGSNPAAKAILGKHSKTISRAQRRVLGAPCPVCDDRACETNSEECGK